MTILSTLDMDALAASVRRKREATGLGLNVRFLRKDGALDEYSFATVENAESFRAELIRKGIHLVDRTWLAAAYVDQIGYDPFEDDPTITEMEVARTLIEYAKDVAAS